MNTLEVGNLWYFFYLLVTALIFAIGMLIFKDKSEKAKYWFVFALAMINFTAHFLRMLLPEYNGPDTDYPTTWRKVTYENVCTTSVLMFPFIHLSKSKILKDYIVFMSLIGGVLGVFVPVGAWHYAPFRLESIRYYITHSGLLIQGGLTLALGLHRPSYKRFWVAPITFFFVLGGIALNELVIRSIGLTGQTLADMTDNPMERNSVFIFGPSESIQKQFGFVFWVVPEFMKHGVGYRAGEDFYWPWAWMFIPLMTYGQILAHAIGFTWGWKDLRNDLWRKKYGEEGLQERLQVIQDKKRTQRAARKQRRMQKRNSRAKA